MKATETPLVNMLKGPRQFLIPIYQRAYSWTEEQCAQLWEDVLRVAQDDRYPAHFIGSVVYIEHGLYQATAIPQLLVIDGQQRLTTVTLMIEALARALESQGSRLRGEITDRKLRNYFLFNPEEDGGAALQACSSPRETWILCGPSSSGRRCRRRPARHLVDNFEYFQEQLESARSRRTCCTGGSRKLLVVDVALDRDHDNPQLIFESLNSTGLDLSQSDLIRNFVLMGLEPAEQEALYEDHWRPMERTLARADRDDVFDRFLRAWLTLRLGEVPNIRRGYETFKRYRSMNPDQPMSELVADLHGCAEHYACIALGRESHPDLSRVFRGLQALRIDAPMPFLMHAYALWKAGTVSEEDMVKIARLMESWLFRRAVCDIPSNVLSRTFATLPAQLDGTCLLESLAAYLVLRTGRQRFPRDEEFRAALANRNLYEFKHRQYCLTRLENDGRKEPVDIGQYTIEHVLPQNENLSAEWKAMLGPDWQSVQERWLHTLGNLTLTGYNPELSDSPFLTKRDMEGGFADSPLRLNRMLAKTEVWNESSIKKRAAELSQRALAIWPAPTIADDVLARYRKEPRSRGTRPRANIDHFKMSETTRKLFDGFSEGAALLGLEPTIWKRFIGIGKPGAGKPYPVIVFPRKSWLLLRFLVSFDDVANPPACAYPHETSNGALRTRAKVHDLDEVGDCFQLLGRLPALFANDLGDGAYDDDDGDE